MCQQLLALNIYEQENFMLSWVEHELFYNRGAWSLSGVLWLYQFDSYEAEICPNMTYLHETSFSDPFAKLRIGTGIVRLRGTFKAFLA